MSTEPTSNNSHAPALVRAGDRIVQYTYQKKAQIGHGRQKMQGLEGHQDVQCNVRVYVPHSDPNLFSRYRNIVGEILKKTEGGCEKKLLKAVYIDPKTGTQWKIVKKTSFWWTLLKILRFFDILNMFHFTESEGVGDYELKQKRSFGEWITGRTYLKVLKRLQDMEIAPPERFKFDPSQHNGLNYSDAFTKLATTAYQYYEHDFDGRDEGENARHINSDWVVILENGELSLVPKGKKSFYKKQAEEALKHFRDHTQRIHGDQKVQYAQHLSYFNFDEMVDSFRHKDFVPLTPEHIYRLNVNLTSVESQDLEALFKKMVSLREWIEGRDVQGDSLSDVIQSYCEQNNVAWSLKEVNAVLGFVLENSDASSKEELTAEHFVSATEEVFEAAQHEELLDALSHKVCGKLMAQLKLSPEARENAYTGRKILKPIEGAYTTADHRFYKPWIDQQELLQAYGELEKDIVEDLYTGELRPLTQEEKHRRFDELSSFIICRKHLFKPHPTEGYRVGEIIPGPSAADGTPRWYRLTRIAGNHEGLLFHYFEPVGSNSHLQSCMVAKSTSNVPYAFEGEATVRNDLNPLNPPGYEGRRHLLDKIEPKRKEHTIPAWVAYQHTAAAQLAAGEPDLDKIENRLKKATFELEKDFEFRHHKKSLHEIVREFDAEFNDITWQTANLRNVISSLPLFGWLSDAKAKYDNILIRHAHDITRQSLESESPKKRDRREAKEKKDAIFLIQYLVKHIKKDEHGIIPEKFQELINELGDHIFHNNDGTLDEESWKQLPVGAYQPDSEAAGWKGARDQAEANLQDVRNAIAEVTENLNPDMTDVEKKAMLEQWEEKLRGHAESIGEDVASKKTNGVRLIGHSLGGSVAQIEAYQMTAGSARLPVPGAVLDAQLYDDPGMSHEDNAHLYGFMVEHNAVMKELKAKINVYRSHDYGDIVPTCATAHLGGITSAVKKEISKKILHEVYRAEPEFVATVREWVKKGLPKEGEKKFEDQVYTAQEVQVLCNEKAQELGVEDLDTFVPQDLLRTKEGRRALKELCLHELKEVYGNVTELKRATHYALESDTGDYAFKHGTRYEMTRREKTTLLGVTRRVHYGILDVDIKKHVRLLGAFVDRTFGDIEAFKEEYHAVDSHGEQFVPYLNLDLCVKLKAASLAENKSVQEILQNQGDFENAVANPHPDATDYLMLQRKIDSGHSLTAKERAQWVELDPKFREIANHVEKATKQQILENALIPLAKMRIARKELEAKFTAAGKKISKIRDRDVRKKARNLRVSEEAVNEEVKNAIDEFKKGLTALEKNYQAMREKKGQNLKNHKKLTDRARSAFVKKHQDFLKIVKNEYDHLVQEESDMVRKRSLGGVKVTHVCREGLGAVSGLSKVDERIISRIWGFGVFLPERTERFRRYVGRHIAPYMMKDKYAESARDTAMASKGHGDVITHRNEKYKTLAVDNREGVL